MSKKTCVAFFKQLALCIGLLGIAGSLCAITNRNLPFWTDAYDHNRADNEVQANNYFCRSHWEQEEYHRTHIYNRIFDGTDADLDLVFSSYNKYLAANGQQESNLKSDIIFCYGLPLAKPIAEPMATTKTNYTQIRFNKRITGVLENIVEGRPKLLSLTPIIEGSSLFFGLSLPLISASRSCVYNPYPQIRRLLATLSDKIENDKTKAFNQAFADYTIGSGIEAYLWQKNGLGDLELHLGLENSWEYKFGMKRISVAAALTATVPTGSAADPDKVLSFSFGRGGWAPGLELAGEIELKHGLGIGAKANYQGETSWTGISRISLSGEPNALSPYKTMVAFKDGYNLRLAPYFWLRSYNYRAVTLDLSIGITWLTHGANEISEMVIGDSLKSIFVDPGQASKAKDLKLDSGWSSRYTNFSCQFSPTILAWKTTIQPKIKISYDLPWSRQWDLPVHRFGVSATITF